MAKILFMLLPFETFEHPTLIVAHLDHHLLAIEMIV